MFDPYHWLSLVPHIQLAIARLPDDDMGRWVPERQTIVLDDRLTQAERRCTLVHELVHRLHKDDPGLSPGLAERQEARCRERTARLLIRTNDLLDALLWVIDEHEEEMAEHLWVDVPTLRDRLMTLSDRERDYLIRRLKKLREYAA